MDVSEVVEHLLRGAQWTASRSSGPGGQHRDKASTRAELTVGLDSLAGLEPELADLLTRGLGLDERPLRITVQDDRSLSRNQQIAVDRLTDLVAQVLAPPSPPRRPTRPSRAKRAARVDTKTRRGTIKRLRRPPPGDE
jgi:ribosome-associated protein